MLQIDRRQAVLRFSVILVDVLKPKALVDLPFDDRGLAFDAVTGLSGSITNPECVQAVKLHGKEGVNITEPWLSS